MKLSVQLVCFPAESAILLPFDVVESVPVNWLMQQFSIICVTHEHSLSIMP